MIARDEYIGWLASPAAPPGPHRGGAGVQRRRALPHPVAGAAAIRIAESRHAIVLNVYTEPDWRRRGLGERVMRKVLAWTAAERLEWRVLYASDAGRSLYVRLGFTTTNGMRFDGHPGFEGHPV